MGVQTINTVKFWKYVLSARLKKKNKSCFCIKITEVSFERKVYGSDKLMIYMAGWKGRVEYITTDLAYAHYTIRKHGTTPLNIHEFYTRIVPCKGTHTSLNVII